MPSNLPDVVLWSVPAFVLLTVVEMVSYRLHPDEKAAGYAAKDAATSITMGLGSLSSTPCGRYPSSPSTRRSTN
ncbi:hypothetical protein SUDANB19_01470 [Streptomyces sp. enrichment culture]